MAHAARAVATITLALSFGCGGAEGEPSVASPDEELVRAADASIASSHSVGMKEISGLATRGSGATTEVLAIGDASTNVAIGPLANDALRFRRHALPATSVQWEGIATDKSGRVYVLEESPGSILVFDAKLEQKIRTIPLRFAGDAWSDANSRGEGLVLLRNGHVLILKEKDPQLIVEVGPEGERAFGYTPGDAVGLGSDFPLPTKDLDFVPLKEWSISDAAKGRDRKSARDVAGDGSELAVAPDGRLYLLSDQSKTISRVERTLRVDEAKYTFDISWRLPSIIEKPEGLTFLPDGRPVVASDLPGEGEVLHILNALPATSSAR